MKTSPTTSEISKALCKFQGDVPTIPKLDDNPFFKSKYAGLPSILQTIKKPLAENGLSVIQFPENEDELTTRVNHTSGEWIEATYRMPAVKHDPQGIGSRITYQRRYALTAVLNLDTDEDDDGNAASGKKVSKASPAEKPAAPKSWAPPVYLQPMNKDNPEASYSVGPMKWTPAEQKTLLASGKFGITSVPRKGGGYAFKLGNEAGEWDWIKDSFIGQLLDRFGTVTPEKVNQVFNQPT